jgi:tetratricopeptide (TPR) repeat protein
MKVLGSESRMVGELLALGVPAELERGNLRTAVGMAQKSVAIYLRDSEPGTDVHAYRLRLLGLSLLAARAGIDAERSLDEAVRVSATAAGAGAQPFGRGGFGLALVQLGKFSAAQAEITRALEGFPPGSRSKHQAMRHQGTLLRLQGRAAESIPWFEQAIAAATRDALDRQDRAIAFSELGLARLALGDTGAAEESFSKAETLFVQFQPQFTTPARSDLLIGTARAQMQRGKFIEALPTLQKADAFWREFAPQTRWAGEAALWLGRCLLALDRTREGRTELSRATALLASSPLPADAELVELARRR